MRRAWNLWKKKLGMGKTKLPARGVKGKQEKRFGGWSKKKLPGENGRKRGGRPGWEHLYVSKSG